MAHKSKEQQRLTRVHARCAGIDVGSREHWVAVDPTLDEESVRHFSSFSDDLYRLADWLALLKVDVVAMEATGVYWIPVYEVLDARGFQVNLVNARATRQVSGRKSDVLDCQWIWQLMSHGLLRGAFRPADQVCALRMMVRQRATKVRDQARTVAHMHKALTQMNLQLDAVLSDLMGKTGQAIVRAIVAGERDPQVLAQFRDRRVRASSEDLVRSLRGTWRAEHLFSLTQALQTFDFMQSQIAACDQEIAHALARLPVLAEVANEVPHKALRSPHRASDQQHALHRALIQVLGVDLTAIPTIGIDTVLVVAGEIGPDLSRFPTCGHFCSAGQALRQAASNARRSNSFIGASHRARLARMDTSKAIKATAHQLARLIYAMLTQGQDYVEKGIEAFEEQRHDRQLRALQRKAHQFGLALIRAA